MKKTLMLTALTGAAALAMASPASATPDPTVCPDLTPTGTPGGTAQTAGCTVVITIQSNNSVLIEATGIGPFDGGDDSLIGIVNNGTVPLTSIALTGADIFGFEGDGLSAYGGGNFGLTGYEGPGTSFTVTDANNGIVNFLNGGIPVGGTAYFSLEENLAPNGVPIVSVGSAAPEPATWAMMILGFGMAGVAFRRRKQRQLAIA
jgi:hypothetical protein